jgi:TetR/AcrR family transcriptional regulator
MGTKERKERERIERRETIIDAAEEVINEKGFDAATVDEIAERAELGKGTLYLYFKSKASIYLAISERGSKILNSEMAKILTLDLTGLEMLRKLGEEYLKFIQANPIYFNAFAFYENMMDQEKLAESEIAQNCEKHAQDAMTYIVRALQIGMQDGSIDNSYDPKELGVIIWGASKGIVQMAFLKNKGHYYKMLDEIDFSLESLIVSFIELIGTGISANNMTAGQNSETFQ